MAQTTFAELQPFPATDVKPSAEQNKEGTMTDETVEDCGPS